MLSMLGNLARAGVAAALAPAAAVVDVVMFIPDASDVDPNKSVFSRTAKMLSTAGEAAVAAVAPDGSR